jgi:oligoribonuclease NrnB/cAMP/cGMP phosphodiesterase (DHH superfamily)
MISRSALVIYHHPCLDGFTSAWAAKQALGNTAEYVPGNYGNDGVLPDVDNRVVYLVDFSYPKAVMLELASRASKVIVLDHHKTAEEDLKELLDSGVIEGEFDMDRSGAMMTWDYFFPDRDAPEFVQYVQDRDLWKKELPYCEEINLAMFSYEYTFANWDDIAAMPIQMLRDEGFAIHRKHMKDVRELTEQVRYMTIGGHKNIPTVNANYFYGSDLCAMLSEDKPFAAYFWVNSEGQYVFGLRSNKDFEGCVDVSAIAASYGGGGHANASGFRIDELSKVEFDPAIKDRAIEGPDGRLYFP